MNLYNIIKSNDLKLFSPFIEGGTTKLKKEELRTIRESLLQKLDIAFMKALEMNDEEKKNKIIFYKNELRDITTKFFPLDINILLHFYPTILNEISLFIQN
jgi:hypothetical protein